MPILKEILLILMITSLRVSTREECIDTKYIVSKCFESENYQWLVEVPETKTACYGKSIAKPISVSCGFTCSKGESFDKEALECKECTRGTYSLGGGHQYIFNTIDNLKSIPPELSLKTAGLVSLFDSQCQMKKLWQVKGNTLQGDVDPDCATTLSLRFKLVRSGSISIIYNLATAYVFGTIKSRCDFTTKDDENDDDDDESDPRNYNEFSLSPTGYGVWKTEKISIDEAGEYTLSLITVSLNTFHFPFALRSIVVEGSSSLQDCILCSPGTYASESGSGTCQPCPAGTYAPDKGSMKCIPCNKATEYSDEGSAKCIERPKCEAKHYRKVFTGCDTSDMGTISYEAIQPKICIGDDSSLKTEQAPCVACNPGMYKKKGPGKCEFCSANTYSNGTLSICLPCKNELSLLPGLYYKNWNELPPYFNRSYMSFDNPQLANRLSQSHSWIPSISHISSQAIPDTLSVLSLTITQGFRSTEIAKTTKEYGTLYFKFSTQCQSTCRLFLVSQDIFDDDDTHWEVINKWTVDPTSDHTKMIEYTHSIHHPNEIIFSWLFTSDDTQDGTDEIRIYEISVTNTKVGGSDRCVSCLTVNNQETECKACTPGNILSNNTCIPCLSSTIASRVRSNDPVPTVCKPCTNNTISDDGISCYVPCKQAFDGPIEYDLNGISTLKFHGSKLFTQKGGGYFHVFNASICGKTSVTCSKTSISTEPAARPTKQATIDSKLCRMVSTPDKNENITAITYIDDFGEQLLNVSLSTIKYFPPLRSDYNLTDITLVYRANASASQSSCSERMIFLSLRCDHILEEDKQNSSLKYQLQTPNDCATGTCDGCTFYFLLRTPFACPTCDENTNGFRTFIGPCKFGRQEVRKIPYAYCSHNLTEKVEIRRCSMLSLEIQIVFGLFIIIAGILILVVIFCWRKNRKLEYRYMQLVENNNPDDDTPVDNVCAQLSDEEDSGEEVQFKTQSKAKKIMNVVRKAIRKNPTNGRSDVFSGDSFLLTNTSTNDA